MKKIIISYWPEIILCSIMWNISFFMVDKTQSLFILGLAAASLGIFAHMIAKIFLYAEKPLKTAAIAGFAWGIGCFGVQTGWAANVFFTYFNLYGFTGFVLWFGAFLMYSLVAAIFAFVFILICAAFDGFFKHMLELKNKFLRHIFLTLIVLCSTPMLFTYLSKISLWPIMMIEGYPFFSPLLPLSSSDKFLAILEKSLGCSKPNVAHPLKRFCFHWIEPKAYKKNMRKNRGLPFNPKSAEKQIAEALENAVAKFEVEGNPETKFVMLAPESSFPFRINEYPETVSLWTSKIKSGQFFLLGTYRSEDGKNFQTTCVMDHTGIVKFFDKKKVTPFAEKKFTASNDLQTNKALIDDALTLVPLVCFEFFIDGSSIKKASYDHELPVIFANDSWFPKYFKTLLRNQARFSAAWYGKNIVYLSHFSDLCIMPFSDNLNSIESK